MSISKPHNNKFPRWDDLELFATIAAGLDREQTLQQIGQDPESLFGSPRMLYLRLDRLEKVLGHRLVDRRPWGRHSRLTDYGHYVVKHVSDLMSIRENIVEHFAEEEGPTLRFVTNGPTFFSIMLDIIQRRHEKQNDYHLGFLPDVTDLGTFAEAISALIKGEADIAFPVPTPHESARLPAALKGEILLKSNIVLLCSRKHKRARHFAQQGYATLDELASEHIIARPLYRGLFLPHKLPRRWTPIMSSVASFAYVRLKLGLGLFTQIGYNMTGAPADILAVPLQPRIMFSYWYVQPRKLWRPFSPAARSFIEDLKQNYKELARKEQLSL